MSFKMFDSRDEVPEAQRETAIETKDGKWAVPEVEDVSALKSAHERQKEETRRLKAALAEREQADKAKEAEDAARKSGVSDEQIAKLRQEIEAAKAPLVEEKTRLEKELRELRLDSKVKAMIAEAGFNPKRIDDVFKLIGDRFDLSENGTPILKDNPAAVLPEYLKTVASKEYPELALSQQKGGDEFKGSGGGGAVSPDAQKLLLSNPGALLAQANAAAK